MSRDGQFFLSAEMVSWIRHKYVLFWADFHQTKSLILTLCPVSWFLKWEDVFLSWAVYSTASYKWYKLGGDLYTKCGGMVTLRFMCTVGWAAASSAVPRTFRFLKVRPSTQSTPLPLWTVVGSHWIHNLLQTQAMPCGYFTGLTKL